MKISNKITNLLMVFIAVGIMSCSSESTESKKQPIVEEESSETIDEVEDEEMIEEEEFSFVMPSALQITSIFQRQGVEFNSALTNPLSNAGKYVTKYSKLMNLGVYTSDLCYNVLNDQSQQSIEHLKVVKQISEDVGMGSIFSSGPLFERFEKNIGKRDSIIYIMADLQEETDLYIKRSEQEHLAMLIFAGAWTEGMFIGLNGTGVQSNREEFIPRLMEQMTLLTNLIKGLKAQPKSSPEIDGYIQQFEKVNEYFENMEGVNLEWFEFDLEKITDAHIQEIKDMITEIRNKITAA